MPKRDPQDEGSADGDMDVGNRPWAEADPFCHILWRVGMNLILRTRQPGGHPQAMQWFTHSKRRLSAQDLAGGFGRVCEHTSSHIFTDQVDSVSVVTDGDGNVQTRTEYMPYGETWYQEGDVNNAPKYNSQELDKETGYYYYNARHYDGEIARFVTPDDIIDGEYSTQGWNRYMYCHGNPVLYEDPTGHAATPSPATPNVSPQANPSGGGNAKPIGPSRKPRHVPGKDDVESPWKAAGRELDAALSKRTGMNGGRPVNAAGRNGGDVTGVESGRSAGGGGNPSNNSTVIFATRNRVEIPMDNKYEPYISSWYGGPRSYDNLFHSGIDAFPLKNKEEKGIPAGDENKAQRIGIPINNLADGNVIYAGEKDGYGNTVIIDHGNNVKTLYAHLNNISVGVGQSLKKGDQIGELGYTGRLRGTGPHVHWEIIINGNTINSQGTTVEREVNK